MSTSSPYDAPFLHDVVTQTAECIVTVDREGVVVFVNGAAEETFGNTADDLVGKSIHTLFHETHDTPFETVRTAAVEGTEPERVTMSREDGRPVTAYISAELVEHDAEEYVTVTIQETALSDRDGDQETSRLLQRVFEGSRDPVLLLSTTGETVADCNATARQWLAGDEDADLVGRDVTELSAGTDDRLIDTARTAAAGESETADVTIATSDGSRSATADAGPVTVEGRDRVLLYLRDTGKTDREKVEQRTEALEAAADGLATLDAEGRFTYLNEAHAEIYGYDEPAELVGEHWRVLYGEAERARFEEQIIPAARETGHWRGEAVGTRTDGSTFSQEVSLAALDGGGLVCVVRDISDRKAEDGLSDERLEQLNRASRSLMQAEDRERISAVAVETAERLFDCDVACVRLLDESDSTLRITAATDRAAELRQSRPACDLEQSFAGQAYRQGDVLVRSADSTGALAETPIAASIHLPLGKTGTLTVASTETASFSEVAVEGAKMLAGNVEAALDRAQREQELREQAADLRQRREQLETVNRINSLVHDLVSDLFRASTQADIQQQVCDRLSESALYQNAWIGELSVTGKGLSVTAASGVDDESVTAVEKLPVESIADGMIAEALETESVVDDQRYSVVDKAATAGSPDSVKAIAVVPIVAKERTFGVLVVNAVHEEAFKAVGTESLGVLGDIVGFALNAVKNRELLLSSEAVQLEFEVSDPKCLAVAVSRELGCRCHIERTVRASDGSYLSYIHFENVAGENAQTVVESVDSVVDTRLVSDREDGCVVEAKREECGTEAMMEYGATMRRAEAEDGLGSLVIEAPQSADVRRIVDAYTEYNSGSELVAKRDIERPVQTAAEFRNAIENRLTDKQHAAITSAYYSGYYEWPRESNGEEIADSMDIASATLHQHLRSAHRELISAFLDETFTSEEGKPVARPLAE